MWPPRSFPAQEQSREPNPGLMLAPDGPRRERRRVLKFSEEPPIGSILHLTSFLKFPDTGGKVLMFRGDISNLTSITKENSHQLAFVVQLKSGMAPCVEVF